MKVACAVSIALLVSSAFPFNAFCGIRAAGKYSGVVVFDRWDGCHLYSGAYIMEVSEKVKEKLRPFAGVSMLIDAQEVHQPINPGDGLITKLQVIGPAEEPVETEPAAAPALEGLSLKVMANFGTQAGDELIIQLSNTGDRRRVINTNALAPTLLAKKQRSDCLGPSDGPSYAAVTRTNINFLHRYPASGSCVVNDLSLAPGLAISPEFDLAPGQSVEAALRFDLSPGEYQFLSGYGGGVHQTRSLASNMISFNVDSAGKPHLIDGETASESVRTRRVGVVCGRVVLPDGTAAADAKVFLWAAPMAKSEPRSSNMAITTADGRFRIESVPEGHYALSAVRVSSHRVFAGASGDRSLADAEVLDLPSFPENCSLQLMIRAKPTYSVRGRTGAANPAAETRTARLVLKTGDAYPFETSAAIQADGRFEFRDVPAGDYQFFAGATGATVDVNADIDDVGIDIGWPGRTSKKTADPDMSADFNEAMTVSELASINQAQRAYAKTYGKGFARNLDVLGTPPEWYHETADHAGLLGLLRTPFLTDEDATHFTQFGYQFTYSAGDSDATGSIASYTVTVRPTHFGKTGEQNFFTDESGVIRAKNADAPATKDDPVVNIQLQ